VLLANVPFIPELFLAYQQETIAEKSLLVRSGIMATNELVQSEFEKGGKTIDLPFFGDLTGDDEILSDVTGLTPTNIGGATQTGVRLMRGKCWQHSDLARELAGSDPGLAIARSTARFWERKMQAAMLSILRGLFGSAGALTASHSAGGTGVATTPGPFIDALAVLGDHGTDLDTYIMHSRVFYSLAKQDLSVSGLFATSQIDTRTSGETPEFRSLFGRRVLVDDTMTVDTAAGTGTGSGANVYRTYCFAPGAFSYALAPATEPIETDRNSLRGISYLINRVHYLVHPNGCRYVGTPAGDSPTNAELATPAGWTKVFTDDKNIKVVELRTYLA
jgi:hypothetical protein